MKLYQHLNPIPDTTKDPGQIFRDFVSRKEDERAIELRKRSAMVRSIRERFLRNRKAKPCKTNSLPSAQVTESRLLSDQQDCLTGTTNH